MTEHAKTFEYATENWPCPLGGSFFEPHEKCIGNACPLWRWDTTESWRKAVMAVAKEIGEDKKVLSAKPEAAAIVAENPRKYGCEGICGLGGLR